MRKLLWVAFTLLLAGGAPPRPAAQKPAQNDYFKKYEARELEVIRDAYAEAYDRAPDKDEEFYWSYTQRAVWVYDSTKSPEANYNSLPDRKPKVLEGLKLMLREPKRQIELDQLLKKVFWRSFGRDGTSQEYDYWRKQVFARVIGFRELMAFQSLYLRDPQNDPDRRAVITRAYLATFGRFPTTADVNYWLERMLKEGADYNDIQNAAINYMLGDREDQKREFDESLKRACAKAGVSVADLIHISVVKSELHNKTPNMWGERPYDWLVNYLRQHWDK